MKSARIGAFIAWAREVERSQDSRMYASSAIHGQRNNSTNLQNPSELNSYEPLRLNFTKVNITLDC